MAQLGLLSKSWCYTMLILSVNLFMASAGTVKICQEEWRRFVYACYGIYSSPLNFVDAEKFCFDLDGKLVTLKSQEENDFVTKLLADAGLSEAYTGLYYENDTEYLWERDTPINYTNWKIEPDRDGKVVPNCVTLNADGKWYTSQCTLKIPYICEKDIKRGLVCNMNGEEFDLLS